MDCSKDEDTQIADEENVLQALIDTEFQENIANTTNNTTWELVESRYAELNEQNTNIESFVDRECIGALNSLATENCGNSIIKEDVNLFEDNKYSKVSDMQNKHIIPEAQNVYVNIPVQQFTLEPSNEMDVDGEDAQLESTNMNSHNQINSNNLNFDTRLIRKLEEDEQVDKTIINQRIETCYKRQEVCQFRLMTVDSTQTLLIKPQDIEDRERNKQISDSSVESMNVMGYSPDNRKRKTLTIFYDNEQFFKDKMLRRHDIQNKESSQIECIENTPTEIKSKSLTICNKYASTNPFASSFLISPLTKIEPIADLQSETDSLNDEYDVQEISNFEPSNEKISTNYTENSVCSENISDINTFNPKANQCFAGNESETEKVLKNTELLSRNAKGINELNILVTSINQQYELDSSSKVNEERKDPDEEKNVKSSYRCPFERVDYSNDSVTQIITDITGDGVEMPTNENIKTTECIIMDGICPSSTKSPQEMHLIKPQNWEQRKNQQVSDSCGELMDITENSRVAQKRKFPTNFLGNDQQLFYAKTLRSFKIQNKKNFPEKYNEATNLTFKTKSMQICNKQAFVKPSKGNLLMNPSKSFELNEVLQLEYGERSLESDEHHEQIESNIILKSTATINNKNLLIKHTENCVNAPKGTLDSAANCLQGILSYIENENETNECKTQAINPKSKLGYNSLTIPVTTKSRSQEVLTNILNATFDKTEIHKIESAPCSADSKDITTGDCEIAKYPELKMNEISSNETLEETFHSGSNDLCEESELSIETNSISQRTSLNNILETGGSETLIKLYLENIEERQFTVENVANFIKENDPSISYFSALHATRIFLKSALRNETLKMINGHYLIPTENLPTSAENSTKNKNTLKFHLKKMINRHYSDTQTITSLGNNNLQENKTAELANEDTATTNITGRFTDTNSHDTTIPSRQDRHGSNDVNSKYSPK